MNYRQLIEATKNHRCPEASVSPATVFPAGARWMHDRLGELPQRPGEMPRRPGALPQRDQEPFDSGISYTAYGIAKYGICLTAAGLTAAGLAAAGISGYPLFAAPLSILVFYLFEIHFLFLFPLLIDRTPRPLLTSIRATYKIGVWRCLITVIPIAVYMLIGLTRKNDRLANWHTGCLAIVIWYDHEIRNRL